MNASRAIREILIWILAITGIGLLAYGAVKIRGSEPWKPLPILSLITGILLFWIAFKAKEKKKSV